MYLFNQVPGLPTDQIDPSWFKDTIITIAPVDARGIMYTFYLRDTTYHDWFQRTLDMTHQRPLVLFDLCYNVEVSQWIFQQGHVDFYSQLRKLGEQSRFIFRCDTYWYHVVPVDKFTQFITSRELAPTYLSFDLPDLDLQHAMWERVFTCGMLRHTEKNEQYLHVLGDIIDVTFLTRWDVFSTLAHLGDR